MTILAGIMMVPFFAWGIYSLQRRFRYRDEGSLLVEAVTIFLLILFFAFEIAQLRASLYHLRGWYLFTVLGLLVSGFALYGHMVVSLLSRLIVDVVVPHNAGTADRPRLGPVEILERQGDYEDALREYQVLARMYPRYAVIHCRIADNLLRLDRPGEAAGWLETALKYLPDDRGLPVIHRLCELYERNLGQYDDARQVLRAFIHRNPGSAHAEALETRLDQIGRSEAPMVSAELTALEEQPLEETPEDEVMRPEGGDDLVEPM